MTDSRAHILTTAFQLFFKKGYKEVTMSELVKESGLSKGAFYHYFSSKEELYNYSMEMFLNLFMDDFQLEYVPALQLARTLKNFIAGSVCCSRT
ncbi:MAG: helix-turn-helix domain-containing protein [Cyclobacteriaceae bacterium]|nr:helix-turn-helix domain-containing protein [Cyclobacteriaceae bacterium]